MNTDEQIHAVYTKWHEATKAGDAESISPLYAEDATFESATVPLVYPEKENGVLHGREAIHTFFTELFASQGGLFGEWYRTDVHFTDGRVLIWEYPPTTPTGQQAGVVEVMELDNGEITGHRVYWGWQGVKKLLDAADV